MKLKTNLLLVFLISIFPALAQDDDTTALDSATIQEILTYYTEAEAKDSLLAYQHGEVSIADGLAKLNLGQDFKYLDPEETNKILVEAWGNPPQETLGMIFPDSINPYFFDGWGVVLYYVEDGHIDDEDAADIDYDDLLEEMQDDAVTESEERRKLGYSGYELLGWAEPPYYDQGSKKLHWAKALTFEDAEDTTLNYDIRVLGRKGYLQLNAIAGINQLPMVKPSMRTLLSKVEFNEGNTYFDFDPSVDKVAAYGVGALVAGKLVAKAGLLKIIGVFLAKSWKLILFAGAALVAFIRKLWNGSEKREIS